jgi:hypothetical protein
MNFIKQFWLLILGILLILGGVFYWYEYRPSKIRMECNEYADKRSKDGNLNDAERYVFRYNFCLSEKGLKN